MAPVPPKASATSMRQKAVGLATPPCSRSTNPGISCQGQLSIRHKASLDLARFTRRQAVTSSTAASSISSVGSIQLSSVRTHRLSAIASAAAIIGGPASNAAVTRADDVMTSAPGYGDAPGPVRQPPPAGPVVSVPAAVVLGIESSCDDTGVAVVTSDGRVLGESIATQADIHSQWGGVVPNLARDAHAAAIDRTVDCALAAAGVTPQQLTAIAVTIGPGLGLCLRVGAAKAREMARKYGIPLVSVHHMEAHALVARLPAAAAAAASPVVRFATAPVPAAPSADSSAAAAAAAPPSQQQLQFTLRHETPASQSEQLQQVYTELHGGHHLEPPLLDEHAVLADVTAAAEVPFPFLCLLISGGHNLLVLVRGVGQYVQLGATVDDALGEAYDKVARLLELEIRPHGGAALEALAREGDPAAFKFAVPMRRHATCDFSFAGLKTNTRLAIEQQLHPDRGAGMEPDQLRKVKADIAASFQSVAVTHLIEKSRRGVAWARELAPELGYLVVAGGVACNAVVRSSLQKLAETEGLALVLPPPRWCTDNGVMVAWAGIERLARGWAEPPPPPLPAAAAAAAPSVLSTHLPSPSSSPSEASSTTTGAAVSTSSGVATADPGTCAAPSTQPSSSSSSSPMSSSLPSLASSPSDTTTETFRSSSGSRAQSEAGTDVAAGPTPEASTGAGKGPASGSGRGVGTGAAATAPDSAEWIELKPRWPLTSEVHPRLAALRLEERRSVKRVRMATPLSELTPPSAAAGAAVSEATS